MDLFSDTLFALSVFVGFAFIVGFFALMYLWARKQKGAAIVFGMLMQMILPDPKVQHTIEMVTEAKQEKSGQEDKSEDDKDKDELS
ncbi:hypothetical protein ALT761_03371 [Alteromonas sp. 76-1]|jgi:hypothetical protein|uniref:hypothetical protein n=1 Tax=Alteromonas sp. 76-1 TaxID=2358187 RepID=UPI000FD172D4|nr:hypothetical protein [Alteromonas sp. 76-1]VEL98353.1 hypothetical protein ALT761_03371 [Alteromonas sp. 76-1]